MVPYLLISAAAVAQWADELDEADRLIRRGLAGHRLSRQYLLHRTLINTRTDTTAARGRHAQVLADLGDGFHHFVPSAFSERRHGHRVRTGDVEAPGQYRTLQRGQQRGVAHPHGQPTGLPRRDPVIAVDVQGTELSGRRHQESEP